MPNSLTKKQKQIYDFIVKFVDDEGYSPSYREIADHFKLASVATVHAHVQSLVSKNYLRTVDGEVRSLEPVQEEESSDFGQQSLPLYGLIAAGEPIEALDSKERIEVPKRMLGASDNHYVLQVKGESMIEEGIFDGDFVVIERREVVNNGDIVVALLNGREATLKRFYKEAKRVRLEPANSNMDPIFVKNDLQIQGRMVGLMRKY